MSQRTGTSIALREPKPARIRVPVHDEGPQGEGEGRRPLADCCCCCCCTGEGPSTFGAAARLRIRGENIALGGPWAGEVRPITLSSASCALGLGLAARRRPTWLAWAGNPAKGRGAVEGTASLLASRSVPVCRQLPPTTRSAIEVDRNRPSLAGDGCSGALGASRRNLRPFVDGAREARAVWLSLAVELAGCRKWSGMEFMRRTEGSTLRVLRADFGVGGWKVWGWWVFVGGASAGPGVVPMDRRRNCGVRAHPTSSAEGARRAQLAVPTAGAGELASGSLLFRMSVSPGASSRSGPAGSEGGGRRPREAFSNCSPAGAVPRSSSPRLISLSCEQGGSEGALRTLSCACPSLSDNVG